MKVLFVPNLLDNWSCHNTYKVFKKFIPGVTFGVLPGEKCNEDSLAEQLSYYDLVHLFFTAGVDRFYNLVKNHPEKFVITAVNERSFLDSYGITSLPHLEYMVQSCNVATSLSEHIAKRYGIKYIPNGIDFDMFSRERRAVVGFIGTASDNKGYFDLKKVCEELKLNLLSICYDEKNLPQEQMFDIYRKMDVFVHPSKSEGCSNVVLEALAMNIPVITTKTGMWKDLERFVTFIEPSYVSIKEALLKYSPREYLRENYDWKNICKEYEKLYDLAYRRIQNDTRKD